MGSYYIDIYKLIDCIPLYPLPHSCMFVIDTNLNRTNFQIMTSKHETSRLIYINITETNVVIKHELLMFQ